MVRHQHFTRTSVNDERQPTGAFWVKIGIEGIKVTNCEFKFKPFWHLLQDSFWVAGWMRLESRSGGRLAAGTRVEQPPLASESHQCGLWTRCAPPRDEASCSLQTWHVGLWAAGDELGYRGCGLADWPEWLLRFADADRRCILQDHVVWRLLLRVRCPLL